MRLHQILGRICAVFSVLVFTFNVFTPDNPDHWLNLAETLAMSFLFIMALSFPEMVAKTLHVILFGTAAGIAVFTDTGFFFSGLMTIATFVLIYAYGGFRTMAAWKLPLSAAVCYGVCLAGVLHYDPPSVETYSRAAVWTLGIAVFMALLWGAARELLYNLTKHNHDLLAELVDCQKGCKDGDKT